MNWFTKNISVKSRKIKANVTPQQIQDLRSYHGLTGQPSITHYKYDIKSENERVLILNNTNIVYDFTFKVIFTLTTIQERKIKVGAIMGIESLKTLKRIIDESKIVEDYAEMLEETLVDEISKSINKDIIENLHKLSK